MRNAKANRTHKRTNTTNQHWLPLRLKEFTSKIKASFILLCLSITIWSSLDAHAQSIIVKQLDQYIDALDINSQFSGQILVSRGDKVLVNRALGIANTEHAILNTPQSKLRIGSIAKVFTALMIYQLRDEGLIDLDAPVSTMISDINPTVGVVTCRQLVSHRAGLPANVISLEKAIPTKNYSSNDLLKSFDSIAQLDNIPGDVERYSNGGFVLLALVIEAVTGTDYEENLYKRILNPCGMTSTMMDKKQSVVLTRSEGYFQGFGRLVPASYYSMSFDLGGGGVFSTASDMNLFNRAFLNGKLIAESSLEEMLDVPEDRTHGAAWRVFPNTPYGYPKEETRMFWHRGHIEGYCSQLMSARDLDVTVVLLSNIDEAPRWQIGQDIFAILVGETPDPVSPSIVQMMVEAFNTNVDVRQRAMELIENYSVTAIQINRALNSAGFAHIQSEDFDTALRVFELNNMIFPNSSNAYAATAFCLAKMGQCDKVQAAADACLALVPWNEDAIESLELCGLPAETSMDFKAPVYEVLIREGYLEAVEYLKNTADEYFKLSMPFQHELQHCIETLTDSKSDVAERFVNFEKALYRQGAE